MKEIVQKTGIDPKDFCKIFPAKRGHFEGGSPVEKVCTNEKYLDSLRRAGLTEEQINYTQLLLKRVGEEYPTISYLRHAILSKTVFKQEDETTKSDMVILEKMFTPKSLFGHREPAFRPINLL